MYFLHGRIYTESIKNVIAAGSSLYFNSLINFLRSMIHSALGTLQSTIKRSRAVALGFS